MDDVADQLRAGPGGGEVPLEQVGQLGGIAGEEDTADQVNIFVIG